MGTTGGASQWNFVPLPMVLFLDYLRQWRRLEINFTGLQAATFSIAISTKVDHFYFANNIVGGQFHALQHAETMGC